MTNREFYQKTFSQVHSSSTIRWEDFAQKRKPPKKRAHRLWILAAAVAVLAALSAGAVAANLMGIRDLLLPQTQSTPLPGESGTTSPYQSEQEALLSLSGYLNSPESQALAEWNDFLASYDPDGSIAKVVGNYLDKSLSKYSCYGVYTQDMADELEDIAARYGLTLHTRNHVVEDQEEWISLLGDFLGDNTAYSGRIYEDGTFHYDGCFITGGGKELDYQFRRSVKGTLNDVYLNIGSLFDYQEWHFRTAGGQEVTLDLGPDKGLVLADLEDSFLLINVLSGTEQGVTQQDLEELADSFDFSLLTPARPPDQSLWETEPQETAPQGSGQSGPTLPASFKAVLLEGGTFYDTNSGRDTTLSQLLQDSAPQGEQLAVDTFTVIDLDGDGTSEVVLYLFLDAGLGTGDNYGWEVLRQDGGGTIYGYALEIPELLDLKTDGSYSYSYDTSHGFGFMFFTDTDAAGRPSYDWGTAPIGSVDTTTDENGTQRTDYYLDYQPVTQAEYESAVTIQRNKEDTSWYPFSPAYLASFRNTQPPLLPDSPCQFHKKVGFVLDKMSLEPLRLSC